MCASISVTIADIWTKFGTEHKYHTPEWPNYKIHMNLKSKMAAAAFLNFGENVNNSGLDNDIYTKFYGRMRHDHAQMITWPKV